MKPLKTKIIYTILIILICSCRTSDSSISADFSSPDESIPEISSENSDRIESGNEDNENSDIKYVLNTSYMKKLLKDGIKYKDSLFFPVHKNNKLKYIEENLDNSGPSEFFMLYSYGASSEETEISYLAEKRNFVGESLSEKYLAAVYVPESGKLKIKDIFPLKYRSVLSDFSVKKLSENSDIKAVNISFSGEEGLSDNFITSSADRSFSLFSTNTTLTEYNRIEDINDDGVIDILCYENLFEEGLGYETFITLHEYSDEGFVSSGSVSVVRTLKAFLEKAEDLLERKNIDLFLKKSVPDNKLSELKNRNLSSKSIIRKIFYPVKKENEHFPDINVFMKNGSRINFVFPEIVENPFRFDRTNIYNFTTYVKVSSESREEAIYLVKIYMNSNPFKNPLFSFHIN